MAERKSASPSSSEQDDEEKLEDRSMSVTIMFHHSLTESDVKNMKEKLQQWEMERPMLAQLSESGKGPLEGGHVLHFTRPRPFPFLKLPFELRLKVYEFAFVDSIHRLHLRRLRRHYSDNPIARWERHVKSERKKQVENGSISPPMSINLLLACKEINHEATPVLYSQNEFEAAEMSDLWSFLIQIRQSRKYISSVDIGLYVHNAASKTFDLLSDSLRLKRLAWRFLWPDQDACRFYNDARILLERVQQLRKSKQAALKLIQRTDCDKISFRGSTIVPREEQMGNYREFMHDLDRYI